MAVILHIKFVHSQLERFGGVTDWRMADPNMQLMSSPTLTVYLPIECVCGRVISAVVVITLSSSTVLSLTTVVTLPFSVTALPWSLVSSGAFPTASTNRQVD